MIEAVPGLAPPRSWRWHFPLRLDGGLNAREHHMARARRVKDERKQTRYYSIAALRSMWWTQVVFPVEVMITRYGPSDLDDDAVNGKCKSVRDEIATMLGVNDARRDKRVRWDARQRRGAYGVEVEIRCVERAT